jgi:hypothetical protein
VKDLYNENCKPLREKLKKTTENEKSFHAHELARAI